MSEEKDQSKAEKDEEPEAPPLRPLARGSLKGRAKSLPASTPELGTFHVLRLSSGRVNDIERSFPKDKDGNCADYVGYTRKVVAEAVVDAQDLKPIFTVEELTEDLDPGEFWSLWREVTDKLNMRARGKK